MFTPIIITVITVFIITFSSLLGSMEIIKTIRKIKKEHGIIWNPLEHLYIIHENIYSGLKIGIGDLVLCMPGQYISQFFLNPNKVCKRNPIHKMLEDKYGKEIKGE